ncbi:enoyl-CoA hydratase/isomerase family protein [Altererythrobacter sp. CC-YST694]|uniref:enoyl-CoA hydratase/isomerase family protein n=1 Tax=Altererythrobacter sp. CC-YST694 TaxID=2755038 RepID=UPI001D01175F|nr:enoyl-CoA hydratase/isomerase family protein [Altererythrobacter sp. CC-YST694]MCB5426055.1 enoyl-CoA hydratase/isomerase family protein [Altererythrobacter sp. CC-YST694]
MSENIHHHIHGSVGHLSLARPRAINALTLDMVEAMQRVLLEWRDDPAVQAVLIDHAEGRGFCAGGDVAAVRRSVLEDGGAAGRAFFREEYGLNHLLFTYPRPVVAFMDGITMGGGVGIAMPATFRVATENTLFAMPEGAIGLFPDVGAGWYLSRLAGRIGPFLALTGARLDGAECLWAGLATHYLPSDALAQAKARIIAAPDAVATILDELSVQPPEARLTRNADKIDHFFASDRLEDILAALEADDSKWAGKELATLRSKSPLTMKVALRQIAEARRRHELDPRPLAGGVEQTGRDPGIRRDDAAAFAEEMRIEYRLAARMIAEPDFAEGVRAVLVDKDNAPRWNPATPEGISEVKLDAIFAPLPHGDEWAPLA